MYGVEAWVGGMYTEVRSSPVNGRYDVPLNRQAMMITGANASHPNRIRMLRTSTFRLYIYPFQKGLRFFVARTSAFIYITGSAHRQGHIAAHHLLADCQFDLFSQPGVHPQVILCVLTTLTEAQIPVGEE